MVSAKKIIRIMDKYKLEKLLLSPQHHNIENGSYDWLLGLFPDMDPLKMKLKIDSIFKSQKVNSNFDMKNQEFINACCLENNRLKLIYTIDIGNDDIIRKLQSEFGKSPFSALKINNLFSSLDRNNQNLFRVINFCRINEMPLLLYAYKKADCEIIRNLAAENQSNTFMIASMSGLEFFELYRDLPVNLFCEINNLNLVSDYRLLKALNIFGPGHLVFSFEAINEDNLRHSIIRICNLAVPETVKRRILALNIETLLN
ncbi:MAG: hypothetical protein JXQ65_03020 [Candidatus Marinimicrobia bacterium]|nr:hypothetical protein [Candidatus Neomarinimicrobiota bacterium]